MPFTWPSFQHVRSRLHSRVPLPSPADAPDAVWSWIDLVFVDAFFFTYICSISPISVIAGLLRKNISRLLRPSPRLFLLDDQEFSHVRTPHTDSWTPPIPMRFSDATSPSGCHRAMSVYVHTCTYVSDTHCRKRDGKRRESPSHFRVMFCRYVFTTQDV